MDLPTFTPEVIAVVAAPVGAAIAALWARRSRRSALRTLVYIALAAAATVVVALASWVAVAAPRDL